MDLPFQKVMCLPVPTTKGRAIRLLCGVNTMTQKGPWSLTADSRGSAGLGRLLAEFSEETLHLVLEALAVMVEADGTAGARWEPRLSPAVLQIWAAHVKDPLLSMDAVAVIQGLASIPAALPSLQVPPCPCTAVVHDPQITS